MTFHMSPRTVQPQLTLHKVTANKVTQALSCLKSRKYEGIDLLPTSIYKPLSKTVASALAHLINSSISTGSFPSPYKIALVTPIHKIGCKLDPGNYRPNSSLPILTKVFEKILNKQIVNHIDAHALLCSEQFGFCHRVSGEQLLLRVLDTLYQILDTKKHKYIAIL